LSHVGNDIVDLRSRGAKGKAKDDRFMQRVLTKEERQKVTEWNNPDELLWAFWSAKETAFKAVNKSHPDISSAPGRYPVTLNFGKSPSTLSGFVTTPREPVAVELFVHEGCVHCIGTTDVTGRFDTILHGIKKIDSGLGISPTPEQESIMVRKLAIEKISGVLGLNPGDINIRRDQGRQGPPLVYMKGKKTDMDISLSHHGRYVAFAFLAENES